MTSTEIAHLRMYAALAHVTIKKSVLIKFAEVVLANHLTFFSLLLSKMGTIILISHRNDISKYTKAYHLAYKNQEPT